MRMHLENRCGDSIFKDKMFYSNDSIAYNICHYTRKRAIVEFVPTEDEHVFKWSPDRFPWYNLENFIRAMLKYFRRHSVTPSEQATRKIVIFEDKVQM